MSNPKFQRPRFFCHIPKTAGTSFRTELAKHSDVLCDYGPASDHTSDIIKRLAYDKKDMFAIYSHMNIQKKSWLAGHMPVALLIK